MAEVNGETVVEAVPRPFTCTLEIAEIVRQSEEEGTKIEKAVVLTIYHENGVARHFLPGQYAIWLGGELIKSGQEAKSPLQVVKDMPKIVGPNG